MSLIERMRSFFVERSWTVDTESLPRRRRLSYHLGRLVYGTYRGVIDQRLTFKAAALTYYSVLSVVPLLAFAFAVLKGFGVYQRFVAGSLRPYINTTFGENPRLLSAIEQVLTFVDQTQVSSLGVFGLLLLLYSGISLLSTVEGTLNQVWGATRSRSFVRRLTDYTTIIVVTPLLAVTATTIGTAARTSSVVEWLRHTLSLGPLIDVLLRLTSLFLGCATLISLFALMPNVRTRPRSVVIGGLVGGILWQIVLILYVWLQSGVASYNALYASFAAFPIFLVWVYLSWAAVLVGAQVGAVDQNAKRLGYEIRSPTIDHAMRDMLSVAVGVQVTRRFLDGDPPLSREALAARLRLDPHALDRTLDALVANHILVRVLGEHDLHGYTLARDPAAIRLSDVRDAVRFDPRAADLRRSVESALHPRVNEALRTLDESLHESERNSSLRDLALAVAVDPSAGTSSVSDPRPPLP